MLCVSALKLVVCKCAETCNSGLKFEGALRERMGTVEVADQVEILQHVIAKGFVDPARVAVEGTTCSSCFTVCMCVYV